MKVVYKKSIIDKLFDSIAGVVLWEARLHNFVLTKAEE